MSGHKYTDSEGMQNYNYRVGVLIRRTPGFRMCPDEPCEQGLDRYRTRKFDDEFSCAARSWCSDTKYTATYRTVFSHLVHASSVKFIINIMDPYTPRARPARKNNLTLSAKEYTKVAICFN